ncbi:hypothetical protein F441_19957, partial [Phytophthora nicotianae CJ01A1]
STGVLDGETAYVELKIVENGALWKEKRGVAVVNVVGGDTKEIIDEGIHVKNDGSLLCRATAYSVIWEQHRTPQDV